MGPFLFIGILPLCRFAAFKKNRGKAPPYLCLLSIEFACKYIDIKHFYLSGILIAIFILSNEAAKLRVLRWIRFYMWQ